MKKSTSLPRWIKPARPRRPFLRALAPQLRALGVSTICESARCPNLGECFSRQEASFLLMGEVCTRACRFCAVAPGAPAPLDADEPGRVARAIKALQLEHVVLTCVTRDDLPDGGAAHLVAALSEIRKLTPRTSVELLVSDLKGDPAAIKVVAQMRPDVFAHNVETVPRLYAQARPQADWHRSLGLLSRAKEFAPTLLTKSGLMVGLGETRPEVLQALRDLRAAQVDIVTLGQFLSPGAEFLPVVEYLPPAAFEEFAAAARQLGFAAVVSGPLVRSSYGAKEAMEKARAQAQAVSDEPKQAETR